MLHKLLQALTVALFVVGFMGPAVAQESIGHADPNDIGTVLDYRLPDWGYRTWDADFGFSGDGRDGSSQDSDLVSNSNRFSLGSTSLWQHYGEERDRNLVVDLTGRYARSHLGTSVSERSSLDYSGNTSVSGGWYEYLDGGPFMVGMSAGAGWNYQERETSDSRRPEDDKRVSRTTSLRMAPTVGIGRVRDVVPVIRAKRLSERLVALGRPPLRDDQVAAVAAVLAREHGYRTVFERPDRSFWRDVLEPMLDPANPLGTYEIFYLRDALVEDTGYRAQGTALALSISYDETTGRIWDSEWANRNRGARVGLSTYRNLSLHHQVSCVTDVGLFKRNDRDEASTSANSSLRLAHLWQVADRYQLTTSAYGYFTYYEVENGIRRDLDSGLTSVLRVFVEDSMAVVASTSLGYGMSDNSERLENHGWDWTYGIGLEYSLDSFLY